MNAETYHKILAELKPVHVQLLAVSKTRTPEEILKLYALGQRDFGENYVQELLEKQPKLPADIRWHFIGHLQTNKVRSIAPFIYMIQGVDSLKLLLEIDKQAARQQRIIRCLLQIHIAQEETKFGLSEAEFAELLPRIQELRRSGKLNQVQIAGLMGMASLTADEARIREEFGQLRYLFLRLQQALPQEQIDTLSMGMSNDYPVAIAAGSTMIRIGTALFGERHYAKG
jgi:pyridoxal phosphate enzyme (YggS family)